MAENPDYRDLLLAFGLWSVEYLIVGGYAVMKYTEPRFTRDLDLWVRNSAENSARVYNALADFGAPVQQTGVTPETFTNPELVYQIGVPPVRIDISTFADGIIFEEAWPKRVSGVLFGVNVNVISVADLITNKSAAARPMDLEDVKRLKSSQSLGSG